MQDGCKVHVNSYMASNGSYFMVGGIVFKNLFLPNTKPGDHGTLEAHNR